MCGLELEWGLVLGFMRVGARVGVAIENRVVDILGLELALRTFGVGIMFGRVWVRDMEI